MPAPISVVRVGNVQLSVWENKSGDNIIQSVTIDKSYKDPKTGEWKKSTSFKYSELTFIKLAIEEALKDKYLKVDGGI